MNSRAYLGAMGLAGWSRSCLTMQGYGGLGDSDRRRLGLALRFSPALCFAGTAVGLAFESPAILFGMAATALVGGFLTSKHPFDYVWQLAGGPPVPPSPPPRRFACQIATPWLVAIAAAFLTGADGLALGLGIAFLIVSGTVATTNWCLPSFVYRLLHRRAVPA